MSPSVELELLDGDYAVTLLPPGRALPGWVAGPGFVNVSFCDDELSIVTPAARVPAGVTSNRGWRALKLAAEFAFDQPGVVLSVVRPISENGHAVFVVSTFHRDYLLVRAAQIEEIQALLAGAGHRFRPRA